MTGLLDRMERDGYVTREPDPEDRRAHKIYITDKGKGVDPFSLEVTLNDRRVDCEYDPDRKWVRIEDLKALKSGVNRLVVAVNDFAGNSNTRTFSFTLQ